MQVLLQTMQRLSPHQTSWNTLDYCY